MHSFVSGLLGGALIGLSAAILLLFSGDILGASGIVSSIGLSPISSLRDPSQHWKLVLLATFLLTSHLFLAPRYEDKENGLASLSWAAFLMGGFLVGFGTRLGNGCTSGHGICGLPRLSKRSFVAVMTFMSIGILTAILTQKATTPFPPEAFEFLRQDPQEHPLKIWDPAGAVVAMVLALTALVASSFHSTDKLSSNSRTKLAPAAVAGVLFAAGLYVSQMVYPVRVFGFLNLALLGQGGWDATLMFVMGGGCVVSFLAYQVVENHSVLGLTPLSKPLALEEGSKFCVPCNTIIDRDLVSGAVCFGMGWGISGLCPGPAMFLAAVGVSWVLVCYWPAFFMGAFLATQFKGRGCCPSSSVEDPEDQQDVENGKSPCSTQLFDDSTLTIGSAQPQKYSPNHVVFSAEEISRMAAKGCYCKGFQSCKMIPSCATNQQDEEKGKSPCSTQLFDDSTLTIGSTQRAAVAPGCDVET